MLRTGGTRRGNGGGTGLYPSIIVSQSEYFIDFIVILVSLRRFTAVHKLWWKKEPSWFLFFFSFYSFIVCFLCFLPFSYAYLCVIYFNLFAFSFALNMYWLRSFLCVIFVIIINYYWPRLRCVCISLISCKLCVISFSVSAADDAVAAAAPL